jgi:uncharacterized protein
MPEYLAPDVYVEEVDTGSKPIEGVSTSTAGMVGVTERGPVDVPILLTSYGDYRQWFGERLRHDEFGDHCYVPHAVEGFFTNGGRRVYLTRILPEEATRSHFMLHDRGGGAGMGETVLLTAAAEHTGTTANGPLLIVLPSAAFAAGDVVRIGDGSDAEYAPLAGPFAAQTTLVLVHLPLGRSHDTGASVESSTYVTGNAVNARPVGTPAANPPDIAAGTATVVVRGANADITVLVATPPPLVEIGDANMGEYRWIVSSSPVVQVAAGVQEVQLRLDGPTTVRHAAGVGGAPLRPVTFTAANPTTVTTPARAGQAILSVVSNAGYAAADLIAIDRTVADRREVRRIGDLHELMLAQPPSGPLPAGTIVEPVVVQDDITLTTATAGTTLNLSNVLALRAGQTLLVGNTTPERVRVVGVTVGASPAGSVTIPAALITARLAGERVVLVRSLMADAPAGAMSLTLDERIGLAAGDVVRVGDQPDDEYALVAAVPNTTGRGGDAGTVLLTQPLALRHARATTVVARQVVTAPAAPLQPSTLVIASRQPATGAPLIVASDGTGYPAAGTLRTTAPDGTVGFVRTTANAAVAAQAAELAAGAELHRPHRAGSPLVERRPLLDVVALDAGRWGDRLRVSVRDEDSGLAQTTLASVIGPPNRIRVPSTAGIEDGTILECLDAQGNAVGGFLNVTAVTPGTGEITLAAMLDPAQQAAIAALPPGQFLTLRSREFRLTVHLRRQPDPAVPSRNELDVDTEMFRNLSLDDRHSRYVHRVIGTTWTDGNPNDDDNRPLRRSDRRSEGESSYVRVRDRAAGTPQAQTVRLGPEPLVDVRPTGDVRPAQHRLEGGNDQLGLMTLPLYIGNDDVNPELRTGLQTMRNYEDISIVACPGQTSATIQGALIDHCELMRYRFAVLDGPPPPNDSLNDVQTQRRQFDTRYAALYHPWLLIPEPFPTNPAVVPEYPIPPSGHVVGVYARTDIERGVHKAPANEVVRGIIGLRRSLNKGEHDILNPYPVNINVVRDFRNNNRGIRVYGGRVITSDPDWKYVNVRRLIIFIEHSLERGLQWVVFEPNAEPLWARVRRSITNFLNVVWRNGALEGTKPEEAFYVRCDRTTMTQTDIDSGRLICLVGVAPVKPAEFVIIRLGLWTAHADD